MIFRLVARYLHTRLEVGLRHLVRGPSQPGWTVRFETMIQLSRWLVAKAVEHRPTEIRRKLAKIKMPRTRASREVDVEQVEVNGLNALWFFPKVAAGGPVILYLHGGGYVLCSVESHRNLMTRLALASGARVLGIDYRLAPEHPFPAALEDAVEVYRWLLARGEDPRRLVVAGDSAGGGLTLATLVSLRDAGDPLPACAVLISPWVDLDAKDRSLTANAGYDYLGDGPESLQGFARAYAGKESYTHPLISPIYADLQKLPPLLVQVGSAEILYDQIMRLVQKLEQADVKVELDVGEGMVHVWHAFADMLPRAREAIRKAGAFVRELTAAGETSRI